MEIKMTFADLLDRIETDFGKTNCRERLMLRKAFDAFRASEEESMLCFDVDFEKEKQRDDWDLTCSCGALFHCENENEVKTFIETNLYCHSCGRRFRVIKNNT